MKALALAGSLAFLASSGRGAGNKGDVETISHGEVYAKNDYVIPGKVSILEFTADW